MAYREFQELLRLSGIASGQMELISRRRTFTQADEEIDRIYKSYPSDNKDEFVKTFQAA